MGRLKVEGFSPLVLCLAVLSLGASAIHFAVMQAHFDEYFLFGVFFAIVAWLQAVSAIAFVVTPSRRLFIAAAAGNLFVVLVWVITRTTGLPFGPEPGEAESASFIDVLSTLLEIGVVVFAVLLAANPGVMARARGRIGAALTASILVVVAPLTTVAIAQSGGHHDAESHEAPLAAQHGTGSAHPSDEAAGTEAAAIARGDLDGGGQAQIIVDTATAPAQIHLTFFDASGGPLAVSSVSLAITEGATRRTVSMSKLEVGHYYGTATVESGHWEFVVEAIADEEPLTATLEVSIA